MADDSTQRRIGRQRAPRVHIRYDVEDGGATESRELPLVAGVVSDLSGDGHDPVGLRPATVRRGRARRRRAADGAHRPDVEGRPSTTGSRARRTRSSAPSSTSAPSDDFSPLGVATQIPQTRKLLETRSLLADLYGKVESSENLDGILGDILADEAKQSQLRAELGLAEDDPDPEDGA